MGIAQILSKEIVGYSRLKYLFRKGINYQSYGNMVATTSRPILGNIPRDLLQQILRVNPNTKREAILKAQEAYIDASYLLTGMSKVNLQAVNRGKVSLENAINIIKNENLALLFTDKIHSEKSAEIILKAEKTMFNKLKTILPNVQNVKITSIGQGAYSDVYKCEILGEGGQKLVADRVIKSYKQDSSYNKILLEKINKILSQYSDEEIVSYAKLKGLELNLNQVKARRDLCRDTLKAISLQTADINRYMATMHGAYAEANTAEYIRYMSGHKAAEAQGIVLPDLFVLSDNPFSVSKFVDGNTKGSIFNFNRLGLFHGDLAFNAENCLNGVCIDLGGIQPIESLNTVKTLVDEARSKGLHDSQSLMIELKRKCRQSSIIGDKEATKILKFIQDAPLDKQEDLLEQMLFQYKDNKKIAQVLKEIQEKNLYYKKPIEIAEVIEEQNLSSDVALALNI